jgi:hypothetical protein
MQGSGGAAIGTVGKTYRPFIDGGVCTSEALQLFRGACFFMGSLEGA